MLPLVLLSSPLGLEEEGLEEVLEEGLEGGLEEEGCCPQFGRCSSASVVVVVVDVNSTPPLSSKANSLLPTPNRFGLLVVLFFLACPDFLVVLSTFASCQFSVLVLLFPGLLTAPECSSSVWVLPHAWAFCPNLSFGTVGLVDVVVVGNFVTSSNRTCSLLFPPLPNTWESPR